MFEWPAFLDGALEIVAGLGIHEATVGNVEDRTFNPVEVEEIPDAVETKRS
jgi:hypothetical protein